MSWFFGLHNYSKPGRGVSKDEPPKTGIALYFDILLRRIWKIIGLNFIYIVFSIPAIVISFFLSTYMSVWTANIVGIDLSGELGKTISLIGLCMTIVLLQICGSGPASAGMTYVLRKYVNDKHSWVWGDFIDNIKSNFRQGVAVYVINIFATVAFVVGYTFYTHIMSGTVAFVLRGLITALALIFVLMQMYIYQLMAGFRLSVKKIYKYAAILAITNLPWNAFSAVVLIAFMWLVYELFMSYPFIAIVLLLTLFFSMLTFTQLFMTNKVVKKHIKTTSEAKGKETEKLAEPGFEDNVG